MKKIIVFILIVITFLIIVNFSVNASSNDKASEFSKCVRGCNEYKKLDQKSCIKEYLNDLSECGLNYKNCSNDKKNIRDCLSNFTKCKKESNVVRKNCGNMVISNFFNCKDSCLNSGNICVNEGESIPVIPNSPVCCDELKLIPPKQEFIVGISGICTEKCGNGICENKTENIYNCAKDCDKNLEIICNACGNECTNESNKICPMTTDLIAVNFECRIINETCTKIIKNNTDCDIDSDCAIFFSNCGCSNYCKNKNYFPEFDCARFCSDNEIDRTINSCMCLENKCIGYKNVENN